MRNLILAATAALVFGCTPAFAVECSYEDGRQICVYEPGEMTFTEETFREFHAHKGFLYMSTVVTNTVPNPLGLPLGSRTAIFLSPDTGAVYAFARRTPDGPVELLSFMIAAAEPT